MTEEFNRERILKLIEKNAFFHFIGLHLEELKYGKFTGKLLIHQHHKQQTGFLHGGVISTLLDTAMGFSAYTVVKENEHVVTANLNVSYFKPSDEGWVIVRGQVEKKGQAVVFCEGELINQTTAELLAKATSSMSVIK